MPAVKANRDGYGFGLGVAVRRQNGVAAMMQRPGDGRVRGDLRQALAALVYQAIEGIE